MSQTLPSMMIFSLVLLGLVALATGNARDLTILPEQKGPTVVTATLARIRESCIFSNDFLFLRRLAYVLSRYGQNPDTYRSGFDGGIWQVSETQYNDTLYLTSMNYSKIQEVLNIDWQQSQWSDLRKPLYSGVAAMLILESSTAIPKDVQKQAEFYRDVWSGKETEFVTEVSRLVIECPEDGIDMAFLLDASGSISVSEYTQSKEFTANVIGGFNVGPDSVRVAVTSFSSRVYGHFDFLDHNTTASAQQAALDVAKYSGGTRTYVGLDYLRTDIFTDQKGSRNDTVKVAIVQTDGKSNDPIRTAEAAAELRDTGVDVYCIGIGNGVDIDELNAIASDPTCTRVFVLEDFTELDSIVADIKDAACKSEIIAKTDKVNNYKCSGQRTFKIVLSEETSIVTYPEFGELELFGSFEITEPNSAFADFSSQATDGKPVVIYVSNDDNTLYLTVDTQEGEDGQCNTTFRVKIVESNALKKTGASNLCLKQNGLEDCSELDYVKSGNFSKVNGTSNNDDFENLCGDGTVGYRSHPETPTKYVYCAEGNEAYVVNCPDGFAYLESQEDCVIPASEEGDAICKVCTSDNWQLGFRRFPLLSSDTGYVECTGVELCQKQECESGSRYLPDDQKCSEVSNSAGMAGVSFINFALCVWSFYIFTS